MRPRGRWLRSLAALSAARGRSEGAPRGTRGLDRGTRGILRPRCSPRSRSCIARAVACSGPRPPWRAGGEGWRPRARDAAFDAEARLARCRSIGSAPRATPFAPMRIDGTPRDAHRGQHRHRRALRRLRVASRGAAARRDLAHLDEWSAPKVQLRMLNHWDNLDRTIERGYAGESIWDWWKLPDVKDPRYVDYARANASIGINGVSLNNVNAKAEMLTAAIHREGRGAGRRLPALRHQGLSSRRASPRPIELGGLTTADPLDPAGARLVEREGRRDLRGHSRFRRLPGQGQFRGPARAAGLRPHPCRRRQHAGRRAGAARRHRDVARLRLLAATIPRIAPSRPTPSSSRSTASSAPT